MAELFGKALTFFKSYVPAAKNIWRSYGYYISLVFLLCLFGSAAYLYRNSNGNDDMFAEKSAALPVIAPAAATAEPSPEPTPYSPLFSCPVSGGEPGKYNGDELVWNDTLGHWSVHSGIDIYAPTGTVVTSAENGTVSALYTDDLLGITVEITHGENWITRYCSLGSTTISAGDTVNKGDVIGSVGCTAISESSDAPHLHFEIIQNGEQIEPIFQ